MAQLNFFENRCAICIETYTTQSPPIQIMTCKHFFHGLCIQKWQEQCGQNYINSKCPLCKQSFQQQDLQIQPQLLSVIIKQNLKIQCVFEMIDKQEVKLQLDQSQTLQKLFELVQIYNKPHLIDDLIITTNNKSYVFEQNNNLLIYDLNLSNQQNIIVTKKKPIQIVVQTIDNTALILEVQLNMSIDDFCNLVSIQTGVSKAHFRFQVKSKPFDATTQGKLSDLPIGDLSIIHQLARLKGGQ
ncbi:hypothetical protein pb186bvf_014896 [Paramecium bursaria]